MEIIIVTAVLYTHTHTPIQHVCHNGSRAGIGYNEFALIVIVVIASIVFFLVPAIVVGIYIYPVGSVIALPCPLIISAVGVYVAWRLKTQWSAKRNYASMNSAAQPVKQDNHHHYQQQQLAKPEKVLLECDKSQAYLERNEETSTGTEIPMTTSCQGDASQRSLSTSI